MKERILILDSDPSFATDLKTVLGNGFQLVVLSSSDEMIELVAADTDIAIVSADLSGDTLGCSNDPLDRENHFIGLIQTLQSRNIFLIVFGDTLGGDLPKDKDSLAWVDAYPSSRVIKNLIVDYREKHTSHRSCHLSE